MKKYFKNKLSPYILCLMLAVATTFLTIGCSGSSNSEKSPATAQDNTTQDQDRDDDTKTDSQDDTKADSQDDTKTDSQDDTKADSQDDTKADSQDDTKADSQDDSNVLGKGDTQFVFTVVDLDENETVYEIHTDKKTVGEALIELDLIQGEESEYGLYVKTVNGITIDPDKDGSYWAFYVDDEYAQTGVDSTEITPNASYAFKAEKM